MHIYILYLYTHIYVDKCFLILSVKLIIYPNLIYFLTGNKDIFYFQKVLEKFLQNFVLVLMSVRDYCLN